MFSSESRCSSASLRAMRVSFSFHQLCTVQTSTSCTMKSLCVEREGLLKVGQEKLEPWYRSASSHRPNPPLQTKKHTLYCQILQIMIKKLSSIRLKVLYLVSSVCCNQCVLLSLSQQDATFCSQRREEFTYPPPPICRDSRSPLTK